MVTAMPSHLIVPLARFSRMSLCAPTNLDNPIAAQSASCSHDPVGTPVSTGFHHHHDGVVTASNPTLLKQVVNRDVATVPCTQCASQSLSRNDVSCYMFAPSMDEVNVQQ